MIYFQVLITERTFIFFVFFVFTNTPKEMELKKRTLSELWVIGIVLCIEIDVVIMFEGVIVVVVHIFHGEMMMHTFDRKG